ncbi:glycosyltransferase family 2 protein [Pseudomonas citronellolis]|uniref:glycosyltransferase family 2 protein n=1 Tax=Pseudomonas citronellolis TaxID=53408 RepID=UPI0023E36798|nr:glycosyltransferase [Pseudomonas citronellolis]MDF3933420.1 glycosyltransferase [Pseudomonas citronellolis]
MTAALGWLLAVPALLALLPALLLLAQVLLACLPPRLPPAPRGARPRVAVLVPAHNESSLVLGTLASVRPQLLPGDRLLVVADNCSDDTAEQARAAGAEVIERSDALRRGKGYALDFGVRHLAADPPRVLIIVDADCRVAEGSVGWLAGCCVEAGRPVQALDLMHAPEGAGLKVRVGEFAWRVKNLVRPRGWARLGLPCQLMGTGMAFAWDDLAEVELASGHLVEDLKLGFDFCRRGKPPLFCPQARVDSFFPSSEEGQSSQRTRWEHGHLGVILGDAPRLLGESLRRRDPRLLAMTLDLLVPPLALLSLAVAVLFGLGWLAFALFGTLPPAALATAALVVLGAAVVLAWARFARGLIPFSVLLYAPFYALRKIPLYLGFLVKRQVAWVRSKREEN